MSLSKECFGVKEKIRMVDDIIFLIIFGMKGFLGCVLESIKGKRRDIKKYFIM